MSESTILKALVEGGMTVVGACAMGGNMKAESSMKANIAQRGLTKLTDEQYTQAADSGTINFANDAVGYGLCQWTFRTRKKNLLDYAKRNGKSVGDEAMQTQFCILELKTDYPKLWQYLCQTEDIYNATVQVCKEYENPAVKNNETRAEFAREMFWRYGAELSSTAGADIDREPNSYILAEVKDGRTPEAQYLAALLGKLGYDVLSEGLRACIKDFQQKTGLTVSGTCDGETWAKVMEAQR